MKKLLALLLLVQAPALAQVSTHKYQEQCWIHNEPTTCTIVDTRDSNGALVSRGIFSNKYSHTFKQRFVQGKGFVNWDSISNINYQWPYEAVPHLGSQVSPYLVIKNISWD